MKKNKYFLTTSIIIALNSSTVYGSSYVYDALNRLSKINYNNGTSIEYHYDPAGNLLNITTGLPTSYSISGQVTDSQGQPLSEVLISLGEYHVLTDEQGNYQFIDIPTGEYTLTATKNRHHFTPTIINVGENQPDTIDIVSDGITQCLLYAVHDENQKNSQFFTIDFVQDFAVKLLGELHLAKDIEAMDIHPISDMIFVASGDDGTPSGALYTLNARTGQLYPVNQTGTGFKEINGLSFSPDGLLWGWAEGDGLILIDANGIGTLIYASERHIEDLTWNNDGTVLYVIEGNQLLAYSSQTGHLIELNCQLPGGQVEGLEMLPDGRILFTMHKDASMSIHALDLNTCEVISQPISILVEDQNLDHLDDIEGLAWPQGACSQ